MLSRFRGDLDSAQRFEHAVRERGGARAAARKREDDEVVLLAAIALEMLELVGRVRRATF